MELFASLVLLTSTLAHHALAVTSQQIRIDLAKTLSSGTEVVLTTDRSYQTDFTQRWTIYSKADPAYNVAAKPATIKDVQKIVQYATKNQVPFLATGGGHGYTTSLSGLNGALNIDLSKFKKVAVDASTNTMTVGASSIFADMLDPLFAAGKQMRELQLCS
jgi:FAD/FMN-containing dehydrogenase